MLCSRCGAEVGERLGLCDRCRAYTDKVKGPSFEEIAKDLKQDNAPPESAPVSGVSWRAMGAISDTAVLLLVAAALEEYTWRGSRQSISSSIEQQLAPYTALPYLKFSFLTELLPTLWNLSAYLILLACISLPYFLVFELLLGGSLGKLLFRLRTTNFELNRLTFFAAIKRSLFRIIPILPISFLLLTPSIMPSPKIHALTTFFCASVGFLIFLVNYGLAIFTREKLTLHDLLSRSVVLRTPGFPLLRMSSAFGITAVLVLSVGFFESRKTAPAIFSMAISDASKAARNRIVNPLFQPSREVEKKSRQSAEPERRGFDMVSRQDLVELAKKSVVEAKEGKPELGKANTSPINEEENISDPTEIIVSPEKAVTEEDITQLELGEIPTLKPGTMGVVSAGPRDVDLISGCAFILPEHDLVEVGLFTEPFIEEECRLAKKNLRFSALAKSPPLLTLAIQFKPQGAELVDTKTFNPLALFSYAIQFQRDPESGFYFDGDHSLISFRRNPLKLPKTDGLRFKGNIEQGFEIETQGIDYSTRGYNSFTWNLALKVTPALDVELLILAEDQAPEAR